MIYWKNIAILTILSLILDGCANPQGSQQVKATSNLILHPHEAIDEDLTKYLDGLRRLDKVAARIFQSNTVDCLYVGRDSGVITHELSDFPKKLRGPAKLAFTISAEPKIIYVRKGGPSSNLRLGDVLIDNNNKAVANTNKSIQTYLAAGFLRVRRDGIEKIIKVSAPPACAYAINLKVDPKIKAKLSGGQITVTSGLLEFTKTDSELAYVLGHELAHGFKNHIKKAVYSGGFLGLASKRMQNLELEADKTGIFVMSRAGYDIKAAEIFLARLIKQNLQKGTGKKRHIEAETRLRYIKNTIETYNTSLSTE